MIFNKDKCSILSCFILVFIEFHSAVAEEKSKMSQEIRGQGGHLGFPTDPKNTNLVEDIVILLTCLQSSFVEFRSTVQWLQRG